MNDATLRKRIAAVVAVDSSRMILPMHAKKQMRKRRITDLQVLHVLRKGFTVEHAHLNIHGNWQCTLEALIAGDRIKVAAALINMQPDESVVVITVMN